MNHTPPWRLFVLGEPRLVAPDGREMHPGGKPLALLAYLALEGQSPRSCLAGLLWPERPEMAARNNLVQLLRRIQRAFGEALITGQETLSLAPNVEVDVRHLFGNCPTPADFSALPLLAGTDFGDHVDLADWLTVQRDRIDVRLARGTARAADQAEAAGEPGEALLLARRACPSIPCPRTPTSA